MMADADVVIAKESPTNDGVAALIAESDAFSAALYPPESNHGIDIVELGAAHVTFLVARRAGQAVGCVALAQHAPDWSEVKRLYVVAAARGYRLGQRLMSAVERVARDDHVPIIRLETGIENHAALKLYGALGFRTIGRFGDYPDDPLSVFMEKRID